MEVIINKKNENPFYGLKNCLNLMQEIGSSATPVPATLDACWNEVKNNKEHREMFFSLLFSAGDITARQHNIFKGKKKDSGGNANREGFSSIINWMWNNHRNQFIKFLEAHLFNEFSCFDLLLQNRVTTVKGKAKVSKVVSMLSDKEYQDVLINYLYKVINGNNDFDKMLVAKFLTLPRLSKRQGHKKMLPETRNVMEAKVQFLSKLSQMMGWEYMINGNICNFRGYRTWRKNYNKDLESVLFSTQQIDILGKDDFLKWFDQLPAQARFRVKNRILYSKGDGEKTPIAYKWEKFQPWVKEWETYKEQKQKEQRVLEEKVRQNTASEEDKKKLEKVKKEAKVTVGATNFTKLYEEIIKGRIDELKLETFIQNKVNLPYNTLVLIDSSGSMTGAPYRFASFIASVCLVKNPDDDGRNLLGFFSNTGKFYSHIDKTSNRRNSILRGEVGKTIGTPLVDPTKSFVENYRRIEGFCHAVFEGGWTDISSIMTKIEKAIKEEPQVKDALMSYPVWTIISDGEFNHMHSPEASFNDFNKKLENLLGFKPFFICMDITSRPNEPYLSRGVERFSGIDNLIYIPSNPAQIEQFLTNFNDMDVYDIYTPLQSIYRSNRYELIRKNTL